MQTLFLTQNLVASRSARDLYFDLAAGAPDRQTLESAEDFVCEQLVRAARCDSDLPLRPQQLGAWMQAGVEEVGLRYREYLSEREAGGARRYFSSKAHALNFLQGVAPTKMVDGAWLYGLLARWHDTRFSALIQTYLEELGEGAPSKNHVVLYKKLLASQGCQLRDDLSDEHYIQGALQLALAHHAERFLPEIIGFNLGYEQLPLHLLITAYELKELGIDPYYFTLHITVDNADSGHARQAVESVFQAMPRIGDSEHFWRRVRDGYALNFLGANTELVVAQFDLDEEMMAVFQRKGAIGQYAHSNYRLIGNFTINEWLSKPELAADFLGALEAGGWFKRGQDPIHSRFWKLIQGEKAKMYGVFSAYEQQVIYDWIAADASRENFEKAAKPRVSSENRRQLLEAQCEVGADAGNEFDAEVRELENQLSSSSSREETLSTLIAAMSPDNHHTASGLRATRLFNEVWR